MNKKLLILILSLTVSVIITGCTNKPQEELKTLTPEEISRASIEKCFDKNGVLSGFEENVKENMNDPSSYELVSISHEWKGVDNANVYTKIRGKNILGALVLNTSEFKIGDDCAIYQNSIITNGVKSEFNSGYAIPPTP